jgi:hypothetical protein
LGGTFRRAHHLRPHHCLRCSVERSRRVPRGAPAKSLACSLPASQEEFSEELRENLLQLEVFKDDIVSDLCDIGADSLGAFKQDCQDHAELVSSDFTDMFSQVIDVAMAKIDTYKAQNVEPVSEQELFARQQQLLAVDQAILDRKRELFDLETKARERLLAADRTVLERNRELFELQMKVREVQGKVDGVGGTETETAKRGERVGSAPA